MSACLCQKCVCTKLERSCRWREIRFFRGTRATERTGSYRESFRASSHIFCINVLVSKQCCAPPSSPWGWLKYTSIRTPHCWSNLILITLFAAQVVAWQGNVSSSQALFRGTQTWITAFLKFLTLGCNFHDVRLQHFGVMILNVIVPFVMRILLVKDWCKTRHLERIPMPSPASTRKACELWKDSSSWWLLAS